MENNIFNSIDYAENFKNLGYAIVLQAIIDYKKDLEFIKYYKNEDCIKKMKISKNKQSNLIRKLKSSKDDIIEIEEFINSEFYKIICPIIDKRFTQNKLDSIKKEILQNEIDLIKV